MNLVWIFVILVHKAIIFLVMLINLIMAMMVLRGCTAIVEIIHGTLRCPIVRLVPPFG